MHRPQIALVALGFMGVFAAWSVPSAAQVEAHLLRVDASERDAEEQPILTTVVEVGESRRVADTAVSCATLSGSARWSCLGTAFEKPGALFKPAAFDERHAQLVLDGAARPAELVSHDAWSARAGDARAGTAWLVVVDTDRRMGGAFGDAKRVAEELIASLRPNDAIDLIAIDDRQIVFDSKWSAAKSRDNVKNSLRELELKSSKERNRGLQTLLKTAASDAFSALAGQRFEKGPPLHQAMLVLASGYGGADPATTGPGASELEAKLSVGRFPETNAALPRAPIPVVSVFFPPSVEPEFQHNAFEFMQALVNPKIGGFFDVIEAGGGARAAAIVRAVRARFDAMQIVRWRLPCVAARPAQSLTLAFPEASPAIAGDATFRDVPIGAPLSFPLRIDRARTEAEAKRKGVTAGGSLRVYGSFCWANAAERARGYFVPRGAELPDQVESRDREALERTRQELIDKGLVAAAEVVDPGFVELVIPADERVLSSLGSKSVIRLVIEDSEGPRASGLTKKSVLVLEAKRDLTRVWLMLGGAVIASLVLATALLLFGRNRRGRR